MLEYVILGILQGLTEWLPLSSQGQVVIVSQLFGMSVTYALKLAIWLHMGTMLAALVYFRKDIGGLARMKTPVDRKVTKFIIVATLITAAIGAPLYVLFKESFAAASGHVIIAVVGAFLIITGLIQLKAKARAREEKDLRARDGILTGVAQGFAALPGISRTGMTTSMLLFNGFSARSALRLSFLMSIIAILIAEIGLQLFEDFVIDAGAMVAMFFAFIVGLATISLLLKIVERVKFWAFCVALGLICFLPLIML